MTKVLLKLNNQTRNKQQYQNAGWLVGVVESDGRWRRKYLGGQR